MKDDTRHWLSAWAVALAFVGAIALASHSPASHGGATCGFDITRTRGLSIQLADPGFLVDRDEPLVAPRDTLGEEAISPGDEASTRPIC